MRPPQQLLQQERRGISLPTANAFKHIFMMTGARPYVISAAGRRVN
jgi:hypothetical protein